MISKSVFAKLLFYGIVFVLLNFAGAANAADDNAGQPMSIPWRPQTEYNACGCGCCSGTQPDDQCLYKSKGDTLQKVIALDINNRSNKEMCAGVGCSKGTHYHYCD